MSEPSTTPASTAISIVSPTRWARRGRGSRRPGWPDGCGCGRGPRGERSGDARGSVRGVRPVLWRQTQRARAMTAVRGRAVPGLATEAAGPAGMTWVPGGTFLMGSADFYPEERPVHTVTVDGLWMDASPVTVAEFRTFVQQTGHLTLAEQAPDAADYPGADPALLVPGSLVFAMTKGPVDLRDVRNWWAYVPGANWRHPGGPGTDLSRRDRHPVTHIAYSDALAYAA